MGSSPSASHRIRAASPRRTISLGGRALILGAAEKRYIYDLKASL